jgi:cytochrome oxidase Cu insertion factor (SCO1/SenC/PrrC family)
MRRPSTRQRRFVILTLALITFGMAYYAGFTQKSHPVPPIQGVSIAPPTPAPPFKLQDQNGANYDDQRLLKHWSLLMLDPTGLEQPAPAFIRLMKVHNRLATHPQLQNTIHFLYLPKFSSAGLESSTSYLSNNLIGLHGAPEAIEQTFLSFGVTGEANTPSLYLIGPQGNLHALFTDAVDAATIARDLIKLINSTP